MSLKQTSRPYYDDLDLARGVLMALGVVLHVGGLYAIGSANGYIGETRYFFFDWMTSAIHLFRMPAFFMISGFFCVMSLLRYGERRFLSLRTQRILLPLFVTLITLNVPELWWRGASLFGAESIIQPIRFDGLASVLFEQNWLLHLWFLVVLYIYLLVAALLFLVLKRFSVRSDTLEKLMKLATKPGLLIWAPVLALSAFAPHVVGKIIPTAVFSPFLGGVSGFTLLEYAPYFAIGALVYCMPDLFEKMRAYRISKVALLLSVVVLIPLLTAGRIYEFPDLGNIYLTALGSWVSTICIFSVFYYIARQVAVNTRKLAAPTFTIYLFHHFLVALYGSIAAIIMAPAIFEFLIGVTLIGVICWALHVYVISSRQVLLFLFNGRDLKPSKKPPVGEAGFPVLTEDA